MSKVTVDQVSALLNAVPAGQTVVLATRPGVGPGAVVQRFADEHSIKLFHVRLGAIDPAGPVAIPSACIPTETNSILLFSDIDVARPEALALALRVVVERTIGLQPLPEGCRVILAGERTGASVIPSVLANKLVHINVD